MFANSLLQEVRNFWFRNLFHFDLDNTDTSVKEAANETHFCDCCCNMRGHFRCSLERRKRFCERPFVSPAT